jgi:hypothetical protein
MYAKMQDGVACLFSVSLFVFSLSLSVHADAHQRGIFGFHT